MVPRRLQKEAKARSGIRVILDDQDTLRSEPPLRLARGRRRRAVPDVRQERQPDHELRTSPRPVAGDADDSALHLDEPLHEGEPEPQAPHGAIRLLAGLHEHVEDARQEVGRNPHTGVAHADDRVRALGPDCHRDAPSEAACT